jgi:hypothetical protein
MTNDNKTVLNKGGNPAKTFLLSAFLVVVGAVSMIIIVTLDKRNSHFLFPMLFPFIVACFISVIYADEFSQLFKCDLFFVFGFLITIPDLKSFYLLIIIIIAAYAIILFAQLIICIVVNLLRERHLKRLITFTTDEYNTVHITDNFTFAKYFMIFVLVIVYAASAVVCCLGLDMPFGDLSDARIDISGSNSYTDEEVAQAASVLVDRFLNNCDRKLLSLSYHSDDGKDSTLLPEYEKRHPKKIYTHIIVFYTEFIGLTDTASSSAGDVFNWTWTLARSHNGKWEIVNYGW